MSYETRFVYRLYALARRQCMTLRCARCGCSIIASARHVRFVCRVSGRFLDPLCHRCDQREVPGLAARVARRNARWLACLPL